MLLTRAIILLYALASATLYCGLMPPWEGFDELYHYAIVQHVAIAHEFPEKGKTTLSRELWNSLDYLPVSHYIQPYLERSSTSFDEYFRLTPEQRTALRRGADTMDPAWQRESSPRLSYEAKQAPLTYVLLAPLEAVLSGVALPTRVVWLRTVLSIMTVVLLWVGTRRLAASLGLEGSLEAACLLIVFSCQMFYAATCRVGNDALAAPWLVWFLVAAIESFSTPSWRRTARTAIVMAVGLLIKSSLLVLLPLLFAAPVMLFLRGKLGVSEAGRHGALSAGIVGVLAGPWYVRNVILYQNFTATDETSGMGPGELLRTAAAVPWRKSIGDLLHGGLWTGNNSFVTFSHSTLDVVLALLAVALVLYALRARRTFAEGITIAAMVLYGAVLILITLAFFRNSGGEVIAAMPWYVPVILAPVSALGFAGLQRWRRAGRWIAMVTVGAWAYVALVSWVVKLIPLYGGLEETHGHLGQIVEWYLHGAAQRDSVLSNLCPAPLSMIYWLLAVVVVTVMVASIRVLAAVHREGA